MSVPEPTPSDDAVEIIHRVNRLKIKAGGDPSGPAGRLDPRLVANASAVVQAKVPDYLNEAARHLSELELLLTALMREIELERRQDLLRRIAGVAHEAQAQGTTFGYPLATRFAGSLRDFCERIEDTDGARLQIVKAHVDAFKAVIRGKIANDGGAIGTALVEALETAIERHGVQ
ncbi:MAG: hypothetical protein OHK0024_16940 [Thalassobaculales bacterium]